MDPEQVLPFRDSIPVSKMGIENILTLQRLVRLIVQVMLL